jgi:hypothetical protein
VTLSESDETDETERYNRWQGYRIGQLTLCNSLFLTFSIATLGFCINMLVQPVFTITDCYAKVFFLFSIIIGLLSLSSGSVACLTRLADFRATAQVARHSGDSTKAGAVACWRARYKLMQKWTWRLFYCQLFTFGVQVILLMLTLGITYWARLR